MLKLEDTTNRLAICNSFDWHGHVLRRDKNIPIKKALDLRVKGTRKIGRLKKTWLKTVVETEYAVGMNKGDANK